MKELYIYDDSILGGYMWSELTEERLHNDKCLERYGYKAYSQNDEDGIIHEIFKRIGTTNKTFVEFGVQNGLESNCHLLLFYDWKGLWIEGSRDYTDEIETKFAPVIETGKLKVKNEFITRENINSIIRDAGIENEIDLLSIDIDGNDWHVWNAIDVVNPRVVIIEYNAKFPPDVEWVMPYNATHVWDGSDWFGASLKALEKLGKKRGYQLVGTNIQGANAFFVREDLTEDKFFEPANAEKLYNPLRLHLKHNSGHPAKYCLKDQKEAIGLFNYYKDCNILPGFGFCDMEGDNKDSFAWMKSLESQLIVNLEKESDIRIPIKYIVKDDEILELKVYIDGNLYKEIQVNSNETIISLRIKKGLSDLRLNVPYLWNPLAKFGIEDDRNLGIAVCFGRIEVEECEC